MCKWYVFFLQIGVLGFNRGYIIFAEFKLNKYNIIFTINGTGFYSRIHKGDTRFYI